MNYVVHVTLEAECDVRQAVFYINNILYNPSATTRLLNKIAAAIESLRLNPYRYPLVNDDYLAQQKIRLFPVKNYHLFYTINEQNKTVSILRFVYKKRNWPKLL